MFGVILVIFSLWSRSAAGREPGRSRRPLGSGVKEANVTQTTVLIIGTLDTEAVECRTSAT